MSNYTVEIRPYGALARLALWALPVDVVLGVVGYLLWRLV